MTRTELEPVGRVLENEHDMVILAQGIIPHPDMAGLGMDLEHDGFVSCPDPLAPTRSSGEGVFVAGCAAGPKDIVDSIVEAGAAASEAGSYLAGTQAK